MSGIARAPYSVRPTVRIDLGAITHNYAALQRLAPNAKIGACVKADAYGLGLERVAKKLYGAGCRIFFVATAGEGKLLRSTIGESASIYVFGGPAPRDLGLFFGSTLKPVLNSFDQADIWFNAIKDMRSTPACAVHIDTGMNRLGFPEEEFLAFMSDKTLLKSLYIDHVMSHLAHAPDADNPRNANQLKTFKRLAARLPDVPMSLANTAGTYLGPRYHFDMIRPGIGLYGGKATSNPAQEVSKPVVSLMASVLQVRSVPKGTPIGYNATYTTDSPKQLVTVGAGYADGIPVTHNPNAAKSPQMASLNGHRVPVVGRVSMDLTVLDVTAIKDRPVVGDRAIFRDGFLEKDAEAANVLNYELLTRLNSGRCRREYI